jgi:aryl-alcohol dehydrogenase-like predicted oxidoreductase
MRPLQDATPTARFGVMRYTHLGRTGLTVSRLCLGTMNFGPETDEATSFAIMDSALDAGINFFDSANVYGRSKGRGATEEIVGRWFAQGGGRREKVVIATKLYGNMGEWPNEGQLSALNIRRACDASLKRLQTDYIDLYQMHHVDRATPWDEIWEGMDVLRNQGKILYVGSSNFAGWHIAKAQEAAKRRNFLGLVSEQSHYNLLTRKIELEVLRRPRTTAWASSRGRPWRVDCSAASCARSATGAGAWPSTCSNGSSRSERSSRPTRTCATRSARSRAPSVSLGC